MDPDLKTYDVTLSSGTIRSPCHMLLGAILHRAVRDALGWFDVDTHEGERPKESARQWLNIVDNRPWSFLWICEHINIEPESILKKIRQEILNNDLGITPTINPEETYEDN